MKTKHDRLFKISPKMDVQITGCMSFPQNVTQIDKFGETVALVMGNSLMYCSPFTNNREIGGLFNQTYTNSCQITGVAYTRLESKISAQTIPNVFDIEYIDDVLLVWDARNMITVICLAHSFASVIFELPIREKCTKIFGSNVIGFFAMQTPNKFFILEIKQDEIKIKSSVRIMPNSIVKECLQGYLITFGDVVKLYTSGGQRFEDYYSKIPIDDILVDKKNVLFAKCIPEGKKKKKWAIHLQNGVSYCVNICNQIYELVDHYFINYTKNDLYIIDMSRYDNHIFIQNVKNSEDHSKYTRMVAGKNEDKNALVIWLINKTKNAMQIEVPLALLEVDEDEADEEEEEHDF